MTIEIRIDNAPHEVEPGVNLLATLRRLGKKVPALCYHPALQKPSAACRLCLVESGGNGKPGKLQRACILKTKPGMTIVTESDALRAARSKAMDQLLAHAPQSEPLLRLAAEYGLETQPPPDGCVRCHLCHRVCEEVVKARALRVEHRDGHTVIAPIPGRCIGCGTCANLCPTRAIKVTDRDGIRVISIRDEIIGRHPLERCEGCGQLYATRKFLAHIEQRAAAHPDVKAHHHYCPTCAKIFSDRARRLA